MEDESDSALLRRVLCAQLTDEEETLLQRMSDAAPSRSALHSWRDRLQDPTYEWLVPVLNPDTVLAKTLPPEALEPLPPTEPCVAIATELAARAGVVGLQLILSDRDGLNAYAVRLNRWRDPVVMLTSEAAAMPARLLRALLAHEIAHLQHPTHLASFMLATAMGVITGAELQKSNHAGRRALARVATEFAALRRDRELEADRVGVEITGDPGGYLLLQEQLFESSRLSFFKHRLFPTSSHPDLEVRWNRMRGYAGLPEGRLLEPRTIPEWLLLGLSRWRTARSS